MLDEAWAVTTEPLVCNQIEVHPFINQDKVLAASKKHGMAVVAYVPIARGKVPGAEALERIGKAHGKSAAQVSLRYLVQLGLCADPAHGESGAPEGKPRGVRLQAVGRRDGGAQEAQRHQYARGQSAARAGVGYALMRAVRKSTVLLVMMRDGRCAAPSSIRRRRRLRKATAKDCDQDRSPGGRHWAWERCIGIISEPCTKNEESMSTADRSSPARTASGRCGTAS